MPAPGASAATPSPVVVFAHGNGELIEHWPNLLAPYLELGLSVLLPEYRGYGRSAGRPSEAALVDDFRWFLALLEGRADVDPERLVLHGRSIGGGVVCSLAQYVDPSAMVLWSTFISVDAVAKRFRIPRLLVPDHFDNERALRSVRAPTFIVHGTHDAVIPVSHARRLAQVAREPVLKLYPAGHNDCPPEGSDQWIALARFLRAANVAPR